MKHGLMSFFSVASSGASDVGAGPSYVHPVGHRRVPGANHLHEESGCEPARQEEQEAAGCHLPHQKRGRRSEGLVRVVIAVRGWCQLQ